MSRKLTTTQVRNGLVAGGIGAGGITLFGESVGHFETYGGCDGNSVFASRVSDSIQIEAVGKSKSAMLNLLAEKLTHAIEAGNWPIPSQMT